MAYLTLITDDGQCLFCEFDDESVKTMLHLDELLADHHRVENRPEVLMSELLAAAVDSALNAFNRGQMTGSNPPPAAYRAAPQRQPEPLSNYTEPTFVGVCQHCETCWKLTGVGLANCDVCQRPADVWIVPDSIAAKTTEELQAIFSQEPNWKR